MLWDQTWRPDAARERGVLAGQLAECLERVEELQKDRGSIAHKRELTAKYGLTAYRKERWLGEPYRSTEHALYDLDRQLAAYDEDIDRIAKQASSYSAAITAIDAAGGRRVPFLTRLLTAAREEVGHK